MENSLQVFSNEKFGTIRTTLIDGVPYFVGKDVAVALGYSNTKDALALHVDAEDKRILQRSENATFEIPNRGLTVINESGLYSLILSSKLPQAKEFKRWVTSEVLPAIRKNGFYFLDNSKKNIDIYKKLAADPEFLIQMGLTIKAEKEKVSLLTAQNQKLVGQISELQPKADYYDNVLNSPELLTVSEIAKEFGLTARKLNNLLNIWGYQYKVNGTWLLREKYDDLGWTKVKTTLFTHNSGEQGSSTLTYWTQAGRNAIHEILKAHNFLPVKSENPVKEGDLFDKCNF